MGEGSQKPLPKAPHPLVLKEGLHVLLDSGPVHLDIPRLGKELDRHEEKAKPQSQKAADLLQGVPGGKPRKPPKGELSNVGRNRLHPSSLAKTPGQAKPGRGPKARKEPFFKPL